MPKVKILVAGKYLDNPMYQAIEPKVGDEINVTSKLAEVLIVSERAEYVLVKREPEPEANSNKKKKPGPKKKSEVNPAEVDKNNSEGDLA